MPHCSSAPKNKAPGVDGLTTEAIQACGPSGIKWLTRLFNTAWEERNVPDDWRQALIVPVSKNKGNKRDCGTYRGISLLSHVGKMFAKILEQRIRPIVEPLLSPEQLGFRKGRGCTDAIFALRQISEKTIEHKQQMNIAFVDQEKAFDRVSREILWGILENYGVKGPLLDCVRAIYRESKSAVRTRAGLTNWFPITTGVRQGCVLSQILFIIYMDSITKVDRIPPDDDQLVSLNELLFADDQCLLHSQSEQLQDHINLLHNSCIQHNMKINIEKTEVMNISRENNEISIQTNNQRLKQVHEFKYLGSIFTADGKLEKIDRSKN